MTRNPWTEREDQALRTLWPLRHAVAAALAVLPLLAAAPASAGLVYEAQRQVGTPGSQLHRYQLINEGEMFRETGNDLTWLDWRKLVYVRTEIERYGPGGDLVGWLVMAEPADIMPADVGAGGGSVSVVETPRPVPLPAAIWMLSVALLSLVGMAWRKS